MSIRTYKKDHLKEHAGVTLYSAPNHDGSMPFCVERPCLISLMPG